MFIGTNRYALAVIGLGGIAVVIWLQNWRLAVSAGLALISSSSVVEFLKVIVGRRRPGQGLAMVDAAGSSMPSAAAAITAAVAIAVFLTMEWPSPVVRRIGVVALIAVVVWIGFCVVYLGVHWPTDVLVGWLLGGGIGAGAAFLVERLRRTSAAPG